MGWDAYSSDFKIPKEGEADHPVFGRVSQRIAKEYGKVDAMLHLGGLDVSTCGAMLARATGHLYYHFETDWSRHKVKELRDNANWDFEVEDDIKWAKASARAFLETCADLGLSIGFSW